MPPAAVQPDARFAQSDELAAMRRHVADILATRTAPLTAERLLAGDYASLPLPPRADCHRSASMSNDKNNIPISPCSLHRLRLLGRFLLWFPLVLAVGAIGYAIQRFGNDEPVRYRDPVQHFMYGSTGGERESGFPYWIWQVLPKVCPQHLPGKGYQSLGMLFEAGRDLPVGMSMRRSLGLDRVFLNCAACHTSTVRTAPDAVPVLITGMPAHRFDIRAFESFFFNCAADPKFSAEFIVPEIAAAKPDGLSLLDRYLVYPVAISIMRERLLMLRGRFDFVFGQPDWGPGRSTPSIRPRCCSTSRCTACRPRNCSAPRTSPRSGTRGDACGATTASAWNCTGTATTPTPRSATRAPPSAPAPPADARPQGGGAGRGMAAHRGAAGLAMGRG